MSTERGVNILGYINKQFGLGEGVRSNIRSIAAANIPYVLNDFKGQIPKDILDEKRQDIDLSEDNPYAINLIQINVDNFDKVLSSNDKSYFSGKYNIGFWAWELENFPPYFQHYVNFLDEIWVPSNFCQNAIAQVSSKPVLKFMHSIDIPEIDFTRADFGLPEDKLIYFSIFDYHGTVQRKNPYATIEAFEKAFGKDSSEAILVIKTSLGVYFPEVKKELKEYIKGKSAIYLIEDILPREKLYGLMSVCDVYVSLHRSEGFGLTMAETMGLGKPVIATAYSANTEFMDNDNSILIPYTLIPTNRDYIYSEIDNVWADVNIDEASKAMLFLAKNPKERVAMGDRAKKHIAEFLAPSNIGKKIKSRIDYIYENCMSELNNDEERIILNLRHEKALLQAKVDALKRIKAVQWKLAFKNLTNKLSGKRKKYIWED